MTAQVYSDAPAAAPSTQKLSLFALTMMVVGGMVGAGHLLAAAHLRAAPPARSARSSPG